MDMIEEYFYSAEKQYDFAVVDLPGNYGELEKTGVWEGLNYVQMFNSMEVDTLFVWVNAERLPVILTAYLETDFDFKGLSPCYRLDKTEDIISALKNRFHNAPSFLLVFQRPGAPMRLASISRMIALDRNKYIERPLEWEKTCFSALLQEDYRGIYVKASGEIEDMDELLHIRREVIEEVQLF